MRTRIKICCIRSIDEAQSAIAAGADALGLVGDMPSGPGVIDDVTARRIAASVPPPIATFLLTQRERADEIADHVLGTGVNAVQIVRHIDPAEYPELIDRLPAAIRRVQVVHVENETVLDAIDRYAPFVHAFLLDSGRPSDAILGGTGQTHDWALSAEFVRRSPVPVFLAGGLNAANVAAAVSAVSPYGVDLCSGVRTDDRLDHEKLEGFMAAAAISGK